jgi:cytochrome c553
MFPDGIAAQRHGFGNSAMHTAAVNHVSFDEIDAFIPTEGTENEGVEMTKVTGLIVLLAVAPFCKAADIDTGKTKVATVCAACHGASGVSVSDTVPNLASQRASYIEAQLKAFRDGARKNPIMNAIAAQLSAEDISNVAAFFTSQPGATPGAKSDFMASLARSHVTFPEGYRGTFTKYHAMNIPATKQVRYFFASPAAVQAAKEGRPLPDGTVLINETYAAKLDSEMKPVTADDGFFVADRLMSYGVMAKAPGWGDDIPEMLRNGDWNYAVFASDKQLRPGVNLAECFGCHKPLASTSYTFTLKELSEVK